MNRILTFLAVVCMAAQGLQAKETPIVIPAVDTVINKTAYTIQSQGVTISVSYGSAYPATHEWNNLGQTYFACLAGGSMTISSADSIKGIAINGWVKKNFSADSDYGTIDYMSDEYDDTTGEPVLTISDINNDSVTISCVNQLRCFSVEVYFTENPGEISGEVTDTVRFTAVTVEAADYSEDTTFSTPGHYSYWLSLAPAEGYPIVWLDMYSAVQGDLSGEYSLYNFNVGDYTYVQLSSDEMDYEYAYDQEFTIRKTDAGYHVEGWIVCENEVLYAFVYDGPIVLNAEDALESLPEDSTAPRKLLHNGHLLILRNGRTYDVAGRILR